MENSSSLRNIITEETTLGELLSLLGEIEKPREKMTPKKIAESAGEPVAKADGCLVYGNGYAVYDNGSGRTALWIPDCISFTYRFVQPKETEVGIVPAKETLPDGLLESLPWMIAITLVGDHRVENNLMNRTGSRLGTVDFDSADNGDKDGNAEKKVEEASSVRGILHGGDRPDHRCVCGVRHFDHRGDETEWQRTPGNGGGASGLQPHRSFRFRHGGHADHRER